MADPKTDDRATNPAAPRMRLSLPRLLLVGAVIAGLGFVGVQLGQTAMAKSSPPGATTFASYTDVTAVPMEHFEIPNGPAHQNAILAFIVADKAQRCSASWGTYFTLATADSELDLTRRIALLRSNNGDVRVSFGGAINSELSNACTDRAALLAAYASVVDHYDLSSIDLDLEGEALGNADVTARRAATIKALQDRAAKLGRPLAVWLTLPVSTQGLTDQGFAELSAMLAAKVDVAGVNGMTMDFGASKDAGMTMVAAVEAATTELQRQVGAAYSKAGMNLDQSSTWSKIGITPMIGQNDNPNERLTIADAKAVNAFAIAKGAGLISMWSANRDANCTSPIPLLSEVVQTFCSGVDQGEYRFHNILSKGTSDAGFSKPRTVVSVDPRAVVDNPKTSPFPIWNAATQYPVATKIVWRRNVYQAKWVTKGDAPDMAVVHASDSPWTLVGPVLPGDRPAPAPTVAKGTYPAWSASAIYEKGSRVLVGATPYEAQWWTKGARPGSTDPGADAWVLLVPGTSTP
jgi:chitinase